MREAPKSYSGSFDPGDLENVLTSRAPKLQLSHFAHILLTFKTQSVLNPPPPLRLDQQTR